MVLVEAMPEPMDFKRICCSIYCGSVLDGGNDHPTNKRCLPFHKYCFRARDVRLKYFLWRTAQQTKDSGDILAYVQLVLNQSMTQKSPVADCTSFPVTNRIQSGHGNPLCLIAAI